MRKPRSDRKLNLSLEQAERLWGLVATSGLPYKRIAQIVNEEFGLDRPVAPRDLSRWYKREAADRQIERMLKSSQVAKMVSEKTGDLQATTDALKAALTHWAFSVALGGTDEGKIKDLMSIVAAIDRAALDQAKLKLEVEKFQIEVCERFLQWFNDEKARAIAESNAPKREKIAALREAYFADVSALQAGGGVRLPS